METASHIGLGVTDIALSKRFYIEVLGFEYDRELFMPAAEASPFLKISPPGDMEAVYLYLGDFQIELLRFTPARGDNARTRHLNETGLTHISICVTDVPGTLAKVVDCGGEIVSTMGDIAAILRDPDGQQIEIVTMAWLDGVRADRAARKAAAGSNVPLSDIPVS